MSCRLGHAQALRQSPPCCVGLTQERKFSVAARRPADELLRKRVCPGRKAGALSTRGQSAGVISSFGEVMLAAAHHRATRDANAVHSLSHLSQFGDGRRKSPGEECPKANGQFGKLVEHARHQCPIDLDHIGWNGGNRRGRSAHLGEQSQFTYQASRLTGCELLLCLAFAAREDDLTVCNEETGKGFGAFMEQCLAYP
jgi:hypothetical protein